MRSSHRDNPFDTNKATAFSDDQIEALWVDLANVQGGLVEILKPTSHTPMLLLGGKGSGKTHLMRYCSAPVQAARHSANMARAAQVDGYLGIYVHADALNTDKFARDDGAEERWNLIFAHYFELWLATALLTVLRDYLSACDDAFDEKAFAAEVCGLFDREPELRPDGLEQLLVTITSTRKEIDFEVNNSRLRGKYPDVVITFSTGALVFGIPPLISKYAAGLRDTLFVYLIDEVENFTTEQQRFLNSLIRYVRGNATIKVGARLYGIKTFDTLGSGEPIRRDAEYERVVLDEILRDHPDQYEQLVRQLVVKRIASAGYGSVAPDALDEHFEQLDPSEYWRSIDARLPQLKGREPAYLKSIASDLKASVGADDVTTTEVVRRLALPERRYLEKAAAFFFRKNWPATAVEALELATRAGTQARALAEGNREGGADLAKIISYFDSDILAQLHRDHQQRVPYAGFKTIIGLSQGITRNLLVDLKHIFRRSRFAGEEPFAGGVISIQSQSDGVRDGASWFWEDAQPPSGALKVRDSIESVAILFRTVRYSDSPSECDLCAFSVQLDTLTDDSRRTLQVAENWSYLIRIKEGRRNKNNDQVDALYQLGPMLAPRWEVSEHRRGSMELSTELANAMFDPARRSGLAALMKKRVSRLFTPTPETTDRLI
ncbi:hypothetical protein ACFOON_07990 [Novosphingobium piscinae]|uniref:Uncharacterized protein n=1 Tax=Novosphingobium piscinae TaxID=1507448 RepID=A0A7X1FY91_9SPHN|nr:hypothetical protein [Novosphingobium piscinae]MBC2669233.1 hypothetical protein [Novosphingobium piscinae]